MSRGDLFDMVATAAANEKSDNFRDGRGLLLIHENIYDKMNDGATWVGRFEVLESSSKGDLDPVTKQPVTPNAPGSSIGWPQKIEKFKSAAGNVKAYILNVLGYKESQVSIEDFKKAMQQAQNFNKSECGGVVQALRGFLVRYETYQQQVKTGANAGKWNTYVRFVHVPPEESTPFGSNTQADIAKRRADLDKRAPLSR